MSFRSRLITLSYACFCLSALLSCGKSTSADIEQEAQHVGDTMASVDDSGGSSGGAIAFMMNERKTFERLSPGDVRPSWMQQLFYPQAEATACRLSNTFSTCSNNVITRTFGGCTVGLATFNGTVTLTWNDASVDNTCQMTSNGHSITRDPDFTVTGLRGAVLAVKKTGTVGQKLTRGATAGTFTFTNDGINRKFTSASGTTLFDMTTETVTGLTVTGASRNGRVISGGSLKVTNNLTNRVCTITPTNVTWTSTCNCAVSGTWEGSCTDTKGYSLTLNGCGTGKLTIGTDTEDVTLDRCEGS